MALFAGSLRVGTRQASGRPMPRAYLLVLAALGLLAARPAHAADALHEALGRLQARYETTRTFRAEFHQTVESPTLAGAIESHGRVAFEKPSRMRWDYDPPDRQTIVGDGQTLWIYQPDQKQVIKSPLGEAFQASTPVTFLGGLGHLDQEFDATLERDEPTRWVLRLVPRNDRGIGTLTLTVRKADAGVEEAAVRDPLGTVTRIRFSDEQRNVPLAPSLFQFTPPPGVDVVRPPAS
jgi:outer membrane lipoprotein carrier protein